MSRLPAAGEIWADEITSGPEEPPDWVWQGLIARRNLTLLTSQWKSGKTTLLSVLLGARVAGGALAGLAVTPGKTLVVTEEPLSLWAERARKHQLGDSVCFIPQPFRTIPTEQEWQELLHRALEVNRQHGVDLVVIDPLAPFLRSENQARSMLETLLPLGQLLRAGMAVLLLHHPARGERAVGQAARGNFFARANGSGAYACPAARSRSCSWRRWSRWHCRSCVNDRGSMTTRSLPPLPWRTVSWCRARSRSWTRS